MGIWASTAETAALQRRGRALQSQQRWAAARVSPNCVLNKEPWSPRHVWIVWAAIRVSSPLLTIKSSAFSEQMDEWDTVSKQKPYKKIDSPEVRTRPMIYVLWLECIMVMDIINIQVLVLALVLESDACRKWEKDGTEITIWKPRALP